jgi:hypothetical protein
MSVKSKRLFRWRAASHSREDNGGHGEKKRIRLILLSGITDRLM